MKNTTLSNFVKYDGEDSVKNLRIFLKKIERNMNNSINIENTLDKNRKSKGFSLKIIQLNGLKKIIEKPNPNHKYFIRYFINMYNTSNEKFYGNTFRSEKIEVKINDNYQITVVNPELFYAYVLSPDEKNDNYVVQIIFVETNENEDIINQSCEGWTILKINRNVSGENQNQQVSNTTSDIFLGSPRDLLFKKFEELNDIKINGASLEYESINYPQLEEINYLLPNYIVLAYNEPLPGLLLRYLPKDPNFNEEIKTVIFEDIYLKNVQIIIGSDLEYELIEFANNYREKKYGIYENNNNQVVIKERRLKCGSHNTWCFINSNGLENSITLIKKDENTLIYKGVLATDKYFSDNQSSCAFIIELNYTLSLPLSENQKDELLNIPIGYSVYVPERIGMDNEFRESFFITGPGETIYNEHLWDSNEKIIKINFIISKDKNPFDGTFNQKKTREYNEQRGIVSQQNQMIFQNAENEKEIEKLRNELKMKELDIQSLKNTLKNTGANTNNNDINPPMQIQFQSEEIPIGNDTKPETLKVVNQLNNINRNETGFDTKEIHNIYTEKIITKETTKIINQQPQIIDSGIKINPNEYREFLDYKNKLLERENESKNIEDEYQPKLTYDKRQEEIPLKDKSELISKGILSLDIKPPSENLIEYTLDKEIKSGEFASYITFQFLGYKPTKEIKRTSEIPNKIQFYFDFFNHQNLCSPVSDIKIPNNYSRNYDNLLTLVKEGSELSNDDEEKKVFVQLKYDPSIDNTIDFREFIIYLLTREMPIKVMDVEKNFCIGFIKVPLKDLIRDGKHQIYQTLQYNIYNNYFENKGTIGILLKNEGGNTSKTFEYKPQQLKILDSKLGFNFSSKKKKVICKPITFSNLTKEEKEKIDELINKKLPSEKESQMNKYRQMRMEPEVEKKVRVLRYFNEKNNDISNRIKIEEEKLNEIREKRKNQEKNFQKIQMAEQYRDAKRGNILQKVTQENHQNTFEITLIVGQPHYFNYVISNPSNSEDTFHIVILAANEDNNSDNNNYDNNIISVIQSPQEWESLVRNHGFIKPNNFNIISNNYNFQMAPNESIPLLFKLLTYDISSDEKRYNVYISRLNSKPYYNLTIIIKNSFPVIDHIFQYYVQNNTKNIEIPLSNPFKNSRKKTIQIENNYSCSDDKIFLNVDPSLNFYFTIDSEEEDSFHSFYFFFYLEETRSRLYLTWKIEIASVELIELKTNIGNKKKQLLTINNDIEDKELQLFSNSPNIFLPGRSGEQFNLPKNESANIYFVLFPKTTNRKEAILNCVDVGRREAFKSWLIKYDTLKPKIEDVVEVNCKIGTITNFQYKFINPLDEEITLFFESDNENFLNVVDTQVDFMGNETKKIRFSASVQRQVGNKEVLMFVYNDDDTFSQTLLFKLIYNSS